MTLDATWHAVPANVPLARRVVVAHLRALDTADPPLNDIALATSEAVSNVVNHAYVGQVPGTMRVCVEHGPDEIELTVEDQGSGMAPRRDSPGLGLGMPLIATMTDRFEIVARHRGGTRLCMWFKQNPDFATLPS
jgi:serine/threonine-protein kinase RsbW